MSDRWIRSCLLSISYCILARALLSFAYLQKQWTHRANRIVTSDCPCPADSRFGSLLRYSFDNFDADDDFEDDDDDAECIKPYGNRSLAWTNRYRKLLPYEWAREQAMKLGLRSKEDWEDYLADGRVYQNKYLPSRSDEMYADEWVSWEEFLGIMRSYEDTRYIVQKVLRIQSMEEYTAFVTADTKRAAGLRIPYRPEIVYRDKGWVDANHFFISEEDAIDDGDYRCSM